MRDELEKRLIDKYSFMKPQISREEQDRMGKICDLYGAFGCECGDGWYDLLDEMCTKIQGVYDERGRKPDIIIDQIKEKFATLRFYYHFEGEEPGIQAFDFFGQGSIRMHPGKDDEVHEKIAQIVRWGEERSGEICERCGKPGKLRQYAHYICTQCDECYESREKK